MYDLVMRLPLFGWALMCGIIQLRWLDQYMNTMNVAPIDVVQVVHLATRLSTIAFLLLVVVVVILRTRPSGKARGLEPRIAALAGSFLTYGIVLFPRRDMSFSLEMISIALMLIGTVGAAVALSQLGRSFSIMAETRQLVTAGPYRFVRHPLYLTEGIAVIGLFIQFASIWTALLLVVQITCQLRRIYNEEMILVVTFQEYDTYRRHTARLIPGIY